MQNLRRKTLVLLYYGPSIISDMPRGLVNKRNPEMLHKQASSAPKYKPMELQ